MPTSPEPPRTAEHARLAEATGRAEDDLFSANPWYEWGPYLSERAWGTVREDYSESGDAWGSFPHDHARSRAYRWNEDGMAGISDIRHELCLALALWNGQDAILKERMFGLTGPQGNHGEDVKEYWWFLEGLPSHALLRWRYHYPQAAFPYEQLVHHGRGLQDPELELLDTGVFDDDRYWSVDLTYAKASPTEVLVRIELENHGPDEATLEVLPTLWFRKTWASGDTSGRPRIERDGSGLRVADHALAGYRLEGADGPDGAVPEALFCENETNAPRIFGSEPTTPYPKDGINDHVVAGAATVNPEGFGTKAALRYRVTVPAGGTAELRLRLHRPPEGTAATRPARRRLVAAARSTTSSGLAKRRRTSSTGRSRRPVRRPRRCGCSVRRAPGSCGASRCTRTTCAAGSTATRASRPRPNPIATDATAAGGTSTPSTCSRCRIPGSTRGSRPGTADSTRWSGRISTPRSRSTSSSCCSGSGSFTPTGRSPPTSGTSTTSTRRCT